MSLVHGEYIYSSDVIISSKIILDQDHFCIEVFLAGKGAEIRSESDFTTSVYCGGECDFTEERRWSQEKEKNFFRGRGLHMSFEFAERRG